MIQNLAGKGSTEFYIGGSIYRWFYIGGSIYIGGFI